jgi:hypothetical protein
MHEYQLRELRIPDGLRRVDRSAMIAREVLKDRTATR